MTSDHAVLHTSLPGPSGHENLANGVEGTHTRAGLNGRQRVLHLMISLVLLGALALIIYSLATTTGSRLPLTAVLLAPMTIGFLMFATRWFTLPWMRIPVLPRQRGQWRIAVATTFVPASEPIEMLEVTVRALVEMEIRHDTWVLDEGDSPEVRALCERLGARHFTRCGVQGYNTESGTFARRTKHGNYNAWLDAGAYGYDVIVNVDPDHILEPYFLERTLPYLDDSEVAYVQAAQGYYNQSASLVACGAAEETYAYYSSVQMTSYGFGYPIVTGCHTVQRACALREVGGFAAHDADDLLITIHYRAAGWKGVYVPEVLGRGITPVDWSGYLKQQYRWAKSVIDVKLREFPAVANRLPRRERVISLLHGLYYLQGVGTVVSIIGLSVAMFLGWHGYGSSTFWLRGLALVAALVTAEWFRQSLYLDRRRERGLHWRAALLRFAKWPFVLQAFIDAVLNRKSDYVITSKVRGPRQRWFLVRPHLVAAGLVLVAWLTAVAVGRHPALMLQLLAGVYVTMSALVLISTFIDFPEPYQQDLAVSRVRDRACTDQEDF